MKLFKKIKEVLTLKWRYAVTKYTNTSRANNLTYRAINEYALKCSLLILGLFILLILVILLGIFVW